MLKSDIKLELAWPLLHFCIACHWPLTKKNAITDEKYFMPWEVKSVKRKAESNDIEQMPSLTTWHNRLLDSYRQSTQIKVIVSDVNFQQNDWLNQFGFDFMSLNLVFRFIF